MQNGNDPLTTPYLDIVFSGVGLHVRNGLCIIWTLQIDALNNPTIVINNIYAIFEHHCSFEPNMGKPT